MSFINPITKIQIITLVNKLQKADNNKRLFIDFTKDDCSTLRLRYLLSSIDFFKFNSTNSGEYRVGVSQIIAFIYCGGYKIYHDKQLSISKDSYNIHHLNGIVNDNHPDNLVYLSTDDHQVISQIQSGYLDVTVWIPNKTIGIKTQFNKQGKPIQNHTRFLQHIAAKTLMQTTYFISKVSSGSKVKSLKQVEMWINKIIPQVKSYRSFFFIAELTKLKNTTMDDYSFGQLIDFEFDLSKLKRSIASNIALSLPEPFLIPL